MAEAQFTLVTNNGAITITAYTGTGGVVVIPGTTNGFPVTSIGPDSFLNTTITSLTIPDNVTDIGPDAFAKCSHLTNLTFGVGLMTFGNSAFEACSNLTTLTIPNTVTNTGSGTFSSCSGLTNVIIPTSVIAIGPQTFAFCSSLKNLTIPGSVTILYADAFEECFGLTSVIIPNSVTNIGNGVFFFCTSLTNVTIGSSVTYLGFSAFSRCTNLTSVTIPDSVTAIGLNAFQYCSGLVNVTFGHGLTNISENAFAFSGLTNVVIPPSVSILGNSVFENCSNLVSVTIGEGVTTINGYTFANCDSLTTVTIGSGLTSLVDNVFNTCSNLTAVYFQGNAPGPDNTIFSWDPNATAYYRSTATGWGSTFDGIPAIGLNPPAPNATYYSRAANVSLLIPVNGLLTNVPTSSGVPVLFTGVGTDGFNQLSTNGTTLFTNANFILYTNSVIPKVNDGFQYAVTDPLGQTGTGAVTILINNGFFGQTSPHLVFTTTNITATFFGIPGDRYTVERSTNLTAGLGWVPISTNTAPANGVMPIVDDFQDLGLTVPPLPANAYYRLRYNP